MSIISQTKAAKLAGVSRGTIANRITDGLLSATPEGIDIAELVRVFPEITGDRIDKFLAGERVPTRPGEPLPEQGKSQADSQATADALSIAAEHRESERWLRELVEKRDEIIAEKEAQLLEAQARQDERETLLERSGGHVAGPGDQAITRAGATETLMAALPGR